MSRSIESLNVKEKAELVQEMLNKKNGVLDKDWCDMVMDYDLDCSPETLRKAGVGVKLASDSGMDFPMDGAGTRDVLDDYVERQKLNDLRREIRNDLRQQSRSEMLRETIREAIRGLPELEYPTNFMPWRDKEHHKDMVVGMGDFHFGAEYEVKGLYNEVLNKYNAQVFYDRMEELGGAVTAIARRELPDQITVMMVGDLLDGLLRASQISRLEYGVVDSAMRLSEYLAKWFVALANTTKLPIRVYAVRGNHGEIRPLGSKAGQFPEENLERVVMHYMYERFRDYPYISVEDNDAPMTRMVDVVGYKFLLLHGQGDDIEKIARDHLTLYNNQIDVFMCGHLHKGQTFTAGIGRSGNVLIERVPSLCGIDPYAQSRGVGSPAGATVLLMEEGYGRVCSYPIVLK